MNSANVKTYVQIPHQPAKRGKKRKRDEIEAKSPTTLSACKRQKKSKNNINRDDNGVKYLSDNFSQNMNINLDQNDDDNDSENETLFDLAISLLY